MMTNPSFFQEDWFTTLIAGVSAVGTYIGKSLWDNRKNKKKEIDESKMIDGMRSIATVYSCMEHLKELNGVGRVFLLEVSNNGEIPKPGSKIYARAIDIDIDDNEMVLSRYGQAYNLKKFEEIEVDENYIRMVIQAKVMSEPYVFDVEKHEMCMLKNIYLEQKIDYSEIYHIYSDTKKWKEYIISIASYNNDNKGFKNNDAVRPMIENNIHQIRHNFKIYR